MVHKSKHHPYVMYRMLRLHLTSLSFYTSIWHTHCLLVLFSYRLSVFSRPQIWPWWQNSTRSSVESSTTQLRPAIRRAASPSAIMLVRWHMMPTAGWRKIVTLYLQESWRCFKPVKMLLWKQCSKVSSLKDWDGGKTVFLTTLLNIWHFSTSEFWRNLFSM